MLARDERAVCGAERAWSRGGRGPTGSPCSAANRALVTSVMNNLRGFRHAKHALRLRFRCRKVQCTLRFSQFDGGRFISDTPQAGRRDQRQSNGKVRRGFVDHSCWDVGPATAAQFAGRGGPTSCRRECWIGEDIAKLGKKSRSLDKGSNHFRATSEAKSQGQYQPSDRLPYAFLCRSLAANSRGRVSRF